MTNDTKELKEKLQWLHDLKSKCLYVDSMIDQIVGKREDELSAAEQEFLSCTAVEHVEDTGKGLIGTGKIEHCISAYVFFYYEDLEQYIPYETNLICNIVYELNVIIEFLIDCEHKYDTVIAEINPTFTYYRPESPIEAIVQRITELENDILKRLENK